MFPGYFGGLRDEELEQRRMIERFRQLLQEEQTDQTNNPPPTVEPQATGARFFSRTSARSTVTTSPGAFTSSGETSKSPQNLAAQLKAKQDLCDHYEKVASSVPCTYNTDGERRSAQPWFECYTCWGGKSNFGSCFPCALKCHKGHELIAHSLSSSPDFFCDCGKNNHQTDVCIQYSAGPEGVNLIPTYKCSSCRRLGKAEVGCCYQCAKHCHRGHDVSFAGSVVGRCNCGNPRYTSTKCSIAKPKVQLWE